jgi:hypothetical protein
MVVPLLPKESNIAGSTLRELRLIGAFIKERDNGENPYQKSYFLAMRFASSVRMHRSKNSRPICINTI